MFFFFLKLLNSTLRQQVIENFQQQIMSLHYLHTDNFGGMKVHENYEADLYTTNDFEFFDEVEEQNDFNSINPLIVNPVEEQEPKFKVNRILNEPLNSKKFTDYVNHYQLLDGENKEELQKIGRAHV